jgi:hypothetical protein
MAEDPHIQKSEQDEIDKAAGIHINLYAGLAMLVFGLLMIAWALLRPLSAELDSEESGGGPGGDDDSAVGSRAADG